MFHKILDGMLCAVSQTDQTFHLTLPKCWVMLHEILDQFDQGLSYRLQGLSEEIL